MWKADVAEIIVAFIYFRKTLHCRCFTGLWICLGSWMCQSSEYNRVLNMRGLHRVLNMPAEFLNMPNYAWIWLNMLEYAGIYANMPKYTWMAFVLHLLIVIACLLECCFVQFVMIVVICNSYRSLQH